MATNKSLKNNPPQKKYCGSCQKIKPASDFYACPSRHDGLGGTCKQCKKTAQKLYQDRMRQLGTEPKEPEEKSTARLSPDFDISFLANLQTMGKNGWKFSEAVTLLAAIHKASQGLDFSIKDVYRQTCPNRSISGCTAMRKELTLCAKNGIKTIQDLEDYWKAGRKYSHNAKADRILVPAKPMRKKGK